MEKREIAIYTDHIKLDSFLKFAGLCETGGNAKLIIAEGRIMVNGEVCTARGKKIFPSDRIEIPELSLEITVVRAAAEDV